MDAVLPVTQDSMRRILAIGGDNMKDITVVRESERCQPFQEVGWLRGRPHVYGRNDCLSDSVLQQTDMFPI